MTYQQLYYLQHLDYFQWYRKKHRARTNARKRERYATDPEYRRKELERKQRQRAFSKPTHKETP